MKKLILSIAIVLLAVSAWAQDYQLRKANSTLKVEGTSTLHDWTLDATELTGSAAFTLADNKVTSIEKLNFTVKVEGLKSHKNGMDKNTYEALKSEKHPNILYEFSRVISITDTKEGQLIKTGGRLTIAGVTKSVYLDVVASKGDGMCFQGSTTFKMTDYGVDPPVALMGTVKTGNEIKIVFNVLYTK